MDRLHASNAAASKFGSSFLSGPTVTRAGLFPLNAGLNLRAQDRSARKSSFVIRASAAENGADGGAAADGSASPDVPVQPSELAKTLQLGSLFGLWYLFNTYFNIYNKQVLKVYTFPVTMTTMQSAVGGVIVLLMWLTGLHKRPKITTSQLVAILPLAIVHTMGNLFTNMSLGKLAVSFTHTIKAMEPFFSVLLSALLRFQIPGWWPL